MTDSTATTPPSARLWPAFIVLSGQTAALVITITPAINNMTRFLFMIAGPLVCLLVFLLWFCFASRLPWKERLAILCGGCLIGVAAPFLIHPSMAVGLWAYGVPVAMFVIAGIQFVGRRVRSGRRQLATLLVLGTATVMFALARIDGIAGNYLPELSWRWSLTPEQTLRERLDQAEDASSPIASDQAAAWEVTAIEWPRFRGPSGNSRVDEPTAVLDWRERTPRERWRIPIGPAWSSFACVSGRLFTQEQRGESEVVSCYDADCGALIWQHSDDSRFSDVVSGPGPRATPTYAGGRLYTYGARAALSALDPKDGRLLWQRDLMREVQAQLPVWGFSNSPLVIGDAVIVYAGGQGDHGLVAYSADSGEPLWQIASQGMNFSSAERIEIAGRELAIFGDASGLLAVEAQSGEIAWRFTPKDWAGPAIVQPQQIGPSRLIVPLGDGIGVARLDIAYHESCWHVQEVWSSNKLKPSFNDFVYHAGYLYGFDQNIFVCLDAETGRRLWKAGRYGFGQVLLLYATAQLLVTTEAGELVLLAADPAQHIESGRVAVLNTKTWNHPIVADGRLYLRNGFEAVCLELSSPSSR